MMMVAATTTKRSYIPCTFLLFLQVILCLSHYTYSVMAFAPTNSKPSIRATRTPFPAGASAVDHSSSSSSSILALTPLQGDVARTIVGAALAAQISRSGLRTKKSLSKSGAIAAFTVATVALGCCSIRTGATLLSFYATSSKLTRLGASKKKTLEEDYQVGGKRGAGQVLACSAIGVACGLARRVLVGPDGPLILGGGGTLAVGSLGNRLTLAIVAFFACCAGDTWASELGILSKSNPRMITQPWKVVAPGTNGGVTNMGLAASAAGGIVMGLVHGALCPPLLLFFGGGGGGTALSVSMRVREIAALAIVGLLGGLGGSLLDSLLGATIQVTHYDPIEKVILKKPTEGSVRLGGLGFLSNEMVNVVSTALTALLAGLFARPLLSWVANSI